MRAALIALTAGLVAGFVAEPLRGDVFVLENGGQIRGQLVRDVDADSRRYIVRTESGGIVAVDRDQVKQVIRERPELIEYERIAPNFADTVEDQWKLAEWCRENHLAQQREMHLRRIIELDTDHQQARGVLGYRRFDGQWMTREQWLEKNGLVLYQGRVVTPQEVELLEQRRKADLAEKEWFVTLRRWRTQIDRNQSTEVRDQIRTIDDPFAVKALLSFYDREKHREVKQWYIESLTRIGTAEAVSAIVGYSLHDPDAEIRYVSYQALKNYKIPMVVQTYIQALKDKDNEVVQRAAIGLAHVGDTSTVGPLIDALVTTHSYVLVPAGGNQNPGSITGSFQRPGSAGANSIGGTGGTGVGFNTNKPRRITRQISNNEVLRTLVGLTNVDFSYDIDAWKNWWSAQRQPQSLDARRD